VKTHFFAGSQAEKAVAKGTLKEEDLTCLKNYMHDAIGTPSGEVFDLISKGTNELK
jgi:hypothetical protein